MNDRILISRQALKGTLLVRKKVCLQREDPICAVDLAEKLGVEVHFVAAPSLEGMYSKSSKTVILSSLRPMGRRSYTCAHELGHWWFKHGDCIDEVSAAGSRHSKPAQEVIADEFASHLLMPSWAVRAIIRNSQYNLASCTAKDIYGISSILGVGYSTMVNHLCWSLGLISHHRAEEFLSQSAKEIKSDLVGKPFSGNLVYISSIKPIIPIDLEVGDLAILPAKTDTEGRNVEVAGEVPEGLVIKAIQQGIGRIESKNKEWSCFVRVSAKEFAGRGIYRHLENSDE